MRVESPTQGRLVRVSLRNVPEKTRDLAARPLLREAAREGGVKGLADAVAITRAWRWPSDRTYVISEEAARRVLA